MKFTAIILTIYINTAYSSSMKHTVLDSPNFKRNRVVLWFEGIKSPEKKESKNVSMQQMSDELKRAIINFKG